MAQYIDQLKDKDERVKTLLDQPFFDVQWKLTAFRKHFVQNVFKQSLPCLRSLEKKVQTPKRTTTPKQR